MATRYREKGAEYAMQGPASGFSNIRDVFVECVLRVTGPVLGAKDTAGTERDKHPCPRGPSDGEDTTNHACLKHRECPIRLSATEKKIKQKGGCEMQAV